MRTFKAGAAALAAVAVSTAALAGGAEAKLIRVDFEGTNSSSVSPDNNVVGDGLETISGHVVYDTDTAGTPFVLTGTRETVNYYGAIKEFAFTTGGVSGAMSGAFGSMQVADQFTGGQDRLSFNNIIMDIDDVTGAFGGLDELRFTIGLSGPFSALSAADLPDVFDPEIFSVQKNISLFGALIDPGAQPGVAKSMNFNFTSVTVSDLSEVPLPGAFGLFALGGGLLAAARRRRNRGAAA